VSESVYCTGVFDIEQALGAKEICAGTRSSAIIV
jgi:hypothetical protein